MLFLEGVITFLSPCILPMIPIYVSYFAGGNDSKADGKGSVIRNSLGFVMGFTIVFTLIGALAGSFGALIKTHQGAVNLICGGVVMILGLNYMGVVNLEFLARSFKMDYQAKNLRFFSSILFGMVFSLGWTPCVGTFLGTALMIAVSSGNTGKGILMLLVYSIGLGIPFILCGIFMDSLKETFSFFKKHYSLVNKAAGAILVLTGILMMTGMFYKVLSILAK